MKNNCCGKCKEVITRNIITKEPEYIGCSNPSCPCHQEMKPNKPEEWEDRYDKWVREHTHLTEPGRELEAEKEFFDFIRTQLALARKEERERLAGEVRKILSDAKQEQPGLEDYLMGKRDACVEISALLKTNQE